MYYTYPVCHEEVDAIANDIYKVPFNDIPRLALLLRMLGLETTITMLLSTVRVYSRALEMSRIYVPSSWNIVFGCSLIQNDFIRILQDYLIYKHYYYSIPSAQPQIITRKCITNITYEIAKTVGTTSTGYHDDVIEWNFFSRYRPLVRGIDRSPVDSPHKGQWRGVWCFLWSAP